MNDPMMNDERRRRFELPSYRELSKDQERIRRLPPEGRYLVTGGPGAGKSVVALIRAKDLAARYPQYRFIMYNYLLEKYCRQLLPEVRSSRFHAWFWKRFQQLFEQKPPEINKFQYDWDAVDRIWLDVEEPPMLEEEMLIIDEGQDMPCRFYLFLAEHCENLFVTADENQQLFEDNCNILDIEKNLGLTPQARFVLDKNWRNTWPIAKLAEHFYHNPQVPPPGPPNPDEEDFIPHLLFYNDFEAILRSIINIAVNYKSDLIGIVTYQNTDRERYFNHLRRLLNQYGDSVPLTTYRTGMSGSDIRFDRGGIMVINRKSCKGLEFDNVFIGDLNDFPVKPDSDRHKKDFYVMITRAKKRVYFLVNENKPDCPMRDELPNDPDILKEWRQS